MAAEMSLIKLIPPRQTGHEMSLNTYRVFLSELSGEPSLKHSFTVKNTVKALLIYSQVIGMVVNAECKWVLSVMLLPFKTFFVILKHYSISCRLDILSASFP